MTNQIFFRFQVHVNIRMEFIQRKRLFRSYLQLPLLLLRIPMIMKSSEKLLDCRYCVKYRSIGQKTKKFFHSLKLSWKGENNYFRTWLKFHKKRHQFSKSTQFYFYWTILLIYKVCDYLSISTDPIKCPLVTGSLFEEDAY